MNMLNRGYSVTTLLSVARLLITTGVIMSTTAGAGNHGLPTWVSFFAAGIVGCASASPLVSSLRSTRPAAYRPVRDIAEASKPAPRPTSSRGATVGFETTPSPRHASPSPVLEPSASRPGQPEVDTGVNVGGVFGTAVATMAVLHGDRLRPRDRYLGPSPTTPAASPSSAGSRRVRVTSPTDSTPSGIRPRLLTQGLRDRLGVTRGVPAVQRLHRQDQPHPGPAAGGGRPGRLLNSVNLANVNVFIAALLAATLVYFFASLAIKAVGKTAQTIIVEVRRQFREMPGIMDYSQRPDYARVVDITTAAALRQMILPGVVAVATPIAIGVILGFEAVAGMLMVGTIAGVLLATVLNNGGGAWDNAKKYIESGNLKDDDGNILGKGSEAHAAAVVGDTVGDPFKDTAGPSLHVLVKLLATISLVLAPLFIR